MLAPRCGWQPGPQPRPSFGCELCSSPRRVTFGLRRGSSSGFVFFCNEEQAREEAQAQRLQVGAGVKPGGHQPRDEDKQGAFSPHRKILGQCTGCKS